MCFTEILPNLARRSRGIGASARTIPAGEAELGMVEVRLA